MTEKNGSGVCELYRLYRPKALKEVVGQDAAVKALTSLVVKGEVPHAVLFSGPSGVGKTTLARILARHVGCTPSNRNPDFREMNCADFRGIDFARDVRSRSDLRPAFGRARVWLIDEAGQLTKDAQDAFLKLWEDTPAQAYFFLATTDPDKLKRTVRGRCTQVALSPLSQASLKEVLGAVAAKKGVPLPPEVADAVAERADGSAREALVLFGQVMHLGRVEDQLAAVRAAPQLKQQVGNLFRALTRKGARWKDVAKVVAAVDDDPDDFRYRLADYAAKVTLGGGPDAGQAALVLEVLEGCTLKGRGGLTLVCWQVCGGK